MATGLYSGTSGLALGVGLNRGVSGLWGGASGLINGFGGFNPATLFATGEQGAWYDPSDLTTLFQDSAGTTPVTAAGQSVGLMLDKSQGAPTTGPELIVTGQWAFALGVTESPSGTLNFPTNGATASQANRVSAGVYYRVSFTAVGTGTLNIHVGDTAAGSPDASITTSGTYSFILAADAVGTSFQFRAGSSGGFIGTVSNISVRELPGNHATQSNAAQRPTYGVVPATGRRNLSTFTEQFDNAAWSKSATTVTANSTAAPDGTSTADTLVESTANLGHVASSAASLTVAPHVLSVYLKKGTGATAPNWVQLYTGGTSTQYANFNLGTGAVGSVAAGSTATITNVGNGWYRCVLTFTPASAGSASVAIAFTNNTDTTTRGPAYVGAITSDMFLWGAQLEQASTATDYQRVGTAFDVTEAGVPTRSYLSFDGSDDGMLTGNIVPGTDKAQVFAGVRKLSVSTFGMAVDFGNLGAGSLALQAPGGVADNYEYQSGGSIGQAVTATGYTAPITNVVTGTGDIAGDSVILRANGVQVASSVLDQGTGNYSTTPLYIGRRAGASRPFNGQIFGLIVRFGANLPADTITQTETWMGQRTSPTVNVPLWQSKTIYDRFEDTVLDRNNETIEVR
jgi:hypothetical protein